MVGGGAISPAPARLVIDPATPGSYILALLRDARAADFEISQFQIGSTVVANTTVPRPVLGRMANRSAKGHNHRQPRFDLDRLGN